MSEIDVFVVYYGEYAHVDDIEGIFETREQVEEFRKRFAKNKKLNVTTKKMNPRFFSDPLRIPFLVCLRDGELRPSGIIQLTGIDECAKAGRGEVEREEDFWQVYVMAENKNAAIQYALNKREALSLKE
ncbi:hypothetical protein [Pararcticibacter amylolyticus]|uniref:Uncharacterized protein n=1 Tax=Pararcticibacter amylolyticus TaxID=2173175 RepID=A0A2U2PFV2_9SPHI|nr:hypothetical protein [Pararcticibacter amylolyticus]PWG80204.1 hypothetical protein DDR33_13505 [Pararcticibacter amylolyticus]